MGLPVAKGLLEPFSHGKGYQDWLAVATPAAGANASFTVEARNWLKVLACVATVATDANAANRLFSLDFIQARGPTYLRNFAPVAITANTVATVFHWQEQVTGSEWNTNTPVKVPVASVFLAPGTVVQLTLDNKQVGDQISAILFTLERFDTGPGGYEVGFTPEPEQLPAQPTTAGFREKVAEPHPFPPLLGE